MARPRKNRASEYASLFVLELRELVRNEVARALRDGYAEQRQQIAELRNELRRVHRRLDAMTRQKPSPRTKLGRWVPGGPGRPPKDAADRIAAFARRRGPRPR